MDSFEWLPSESADERYPMQLIAGELFRGEEVVAQVPAGKITNKGWGEIGSTRDIGEPLKRVPDRLQLAWYSFTEDELFEGSIELPHAELLARFQQGFEQPLRRTRGNWSKILVGMGLGGWASVWLVGGGLVRELARAQLPTAPFEWSEVLDNTTVERASYIRSILWERLTKAQIEAHEKHGPPASSWPRYAARYRWKLQLGGQQIPLHLFMRSFNGEREFFELGRQPPGELETVPKQLRVTWQTRTNKKLLTRITLDEREVYEVFDKACVPTTQTVVPTLHVELGADKQVSLVLTTPEGRLPLTRSAVKLTRLASASQ